MNPRDLEVLGGYWIDLGNNQRNHWTDGVFLDGLKLKKNINHYKKSFT